MSLLSIVLPAYNEEENIEKVCEVLGRLFSQNGMEYELVFVNDGSKDRTWEKIRKAGEQYPQVTGIQFSRNFGKESAIFAGLGQARGDAVAVMDCDLQHPPETLIEMYRLWENGYEVVEAVKSSRGKEGFLHKHSAGIFYRMMSRATGIDMQNASDFKLLDRKVVDALRDMPERNMFFRALSSWVGYKTVTVRFEVQERNAGESKWSTASLIRYALTNIVSFTSMPMQLVTISGFVVLMLALILGIQTLVKYLSGSAVEGFTTVILLLLLIGSAIMISLGIIGYYLAKIYDEVKHRPKYLISEIIRGRETEELSGQSRNY
ncbi:MAG: glycosyltransferase family 2 protein [Lachnospiraceae bacterium]|nr:glycosyltransferase family 2 protein [Lachnospiraceae bacterium]